MRQVAGEAEQGSLPLGTSAICPRGKPHHSAQEPTEVCHERLLLEMRAGSSSSAAQNYISHLPPRPSHTAPSFGFAGGEVLVTWVGGWGRGGGGAGLASPACLSLTVC